MTVVLLSILMPALDERDSGPLIESIRHQIRPYGDAVELLIERDDGTKPSGAKRNILAANSRGRYRCFVDDDDTIAENYVERLIEGCRSGADVVTFILRLKRSDRPNRPFEFWKFGPYVNQRGSGLMAANHLCAWRRDIADRIGWCPYLGCSDDRLWFQPLHAAGAIKTVWYVNEVLYHYDYCPSVTRNQRPDKTEYTKRYVGNGLACYHRPDGSILVQNGQEKVGNGLVAVYDSKGLIRSIPKESLSKFYTITLE